MLRATGNILQAVTQLLWPQACVCCGSQEPTADGLCGPCRQEALALAALEYCPRCGLTVGPYQKVDAGGCGGCPEVAFRFAEVVRVGPYDGPLREGIRRLKYRRRARAGRRLGGMLAEAAAARLSGRECDVVTAVPMHWLRRLRTGSDHSMALAGEVARRLGAPLAAELVRVRNTPPQVRLPASARAENVRGAFAVRRPAAVAAATVLLVDDVVTTGSTAHEAARTLLSAGAERVFVAAVARAEPPTAYSRQLREGQ